MSSDGTILLLKSLTSTYNKKITYDSASSSTASNTEALSISSSTPTPNRFRYSDDNSFIVYADTIEGNLSKVDLNTGDITILDTDVTVRHIINNGNNRFTYVCITTNQKPVFKRVDL